MSEGSRPSPDRVEGRRQSSEQPELPIPPVVRESGAPYRSSPAGNPGAVECLGMTFASDDERRAYFLARLREKLQDPEFRAQPGFPIGDDEDILRLSDPPYYTACPNPFLADFVRVYGTPYDPSLPYHVEPFAVDVSEGKTHPLYQAHGYHTKVPHLAIVPPILHYTEPGDLVLDGFAGSGLTGVAAQWCGLAPEADRRAIEARFEAEGWPRPHWGARRAILNDLSPAATFIGANYNLPFDVDAFARAARDLLRELEREIGWMYETRHTDGQIGRIDYTVWSEVFACPECSREIVFLREALDPVTKHVRDEFPCPHTGARLTKDDLQRVKEYLPDPGTGEPWARIKLVPASIIYRVGKSTYTKEPDEDDLAVLERAARLPLPSSVPTEPFPIARMYHGSRLAPKGFTHIHHLFLARQGQSLGALWTKAQAHPDARIRNMLLFTVEQAIWGMSVLNRYGPTHFSQVNRQLSGVYYIPSQMSEVSPWYILNGKVDRLIKAFQQFHTGAGFSATSTGTCSAIPIPERTVDFVFTDPPFGENIYYADLNFLVEAWHRVRTETRPEAIIDEPKGKRLADYRQLMRSCLAEYYRVLKPGRWMTMVFHNSHNSVWNAIQEALLEAGFVVADVRTMDKQQGSYRQVTSSAMKQDLVVSAYRPSAELEERVRLQTSATEDAWAFVREHLRLVPVFVPTKDGQAEPIAERRAQMLYDRTVGFFVQRGVSVPLAAADFYAGLAQRFPEREGMYFLPDQVAEYDRKRLSVRELLQLHLIVTDEKSARDWLRQELERKPQTLQELTPKFLREISGWSKHEQRLELSDLLHASFLVQGPNSPIAAPIVSWMKKSSELRGRVQAAEATMGATDGDLHTGDPLLLAAARGRWYVPDPNRMQDLEKLRERELLTDFEQYKGFTGRTLRTFRLEAVRAGFKKAWAEKDYAAIVVVGRKIPEDILRDDPLLPYWYDNAQDRVGPNVS